MAEIKIEKKKPVWPWVLLIVILLAIAAFIIYQNQASDDFNEDFDDEYSDAEIENNEDDTIYQDNAIYDTIRNDEYGTAAMTALMESMRDSTRFGTDSTYTKNALKSLAQLTVSKAEAYNLESSAALTNLQQYAESNVSSESRMDKNNQLQTQLKKVTDEVVQVIQQLQPKTNIAAETVNSLKSTANKISATAALSKQQESLQSFFRQAHDILHDLQS
ncbi:hypothetical protein M0G43_08550 [Subsaxibacter sp. CAU 1640]|uniref:hypothetical protein n=1 Tax=Subsaxibacter sp. CAU 1640 TaxID=2933271 RepID=UPI0020056399|nr:hypothetical protein [Subsaxibacter sp. CAU 1640]MCK7590620.1 hypothetical protein [Subsaxibacter sp. CAU 1640]